METISPGDTGPAMLLAALTTAPMAGGAAGVTVNVTLMTTMPAVEVMVTVPIYVPTASVEMTDCTSPMDTGAGVVPDAGVTARNTGVPEGVLTAAVKATAPALDITWTVWAAGVVEAPAV